jgi:hypothetical protein
MIETKTPKKKSSSKKFIILISIAVLFALGVRSFFYLEELKVEGGYRSEASGILYDYTPERFDGNPTLLDFSADWCPPLQNNLAHS